MKNFANNYKISVGITDYGIEILNPGLPEDETGIQRLYHDLWWVGNTTGSPPILLR